MKRCAFLALTVLLGLPGLARAQAVTPYQPRIAGVPVSCMSSQGVPVAFVPNTSLADVGLAFAEWPGVPAHVEYNPGLLARLPPGMQLFWFGHVCAHEVLGLDVDEERADCWSLHFLKRQGLVSRAQVAGLQSYLLGARRVPWGHWPEPSRVQRLLGCYDMDGRRGPFAGQGEEYLGVKRWRFCSHIPGVSAPTSSGHVSKASCERERARLQAGDANYVVTECVLTASERCSTDHR